MTNAITTNNTITIDGRAVGRVNQTTCGYNRGPEYQIFRTKNGSWNPHGENVQEHKIYEPAYVGSGSCWSLNPQFFAEIEGVLQ